MIDFFRYLFRSSFWFSANPVNMEWDKKLNYLIDNGKISQADRYTTTIDGVILWTSNYPFSYGRPYRPALDILPRRRTREKLFKFVLAHQLNEMDKI